jgi:hypothetical protein
LVCGQEKRSSLTSLHLKTSMQILTIISTVVSIVVVLVSSLFTSVDVMAAPPQAPSDMSAWPSSDGTIKLSWSASPGASGYIVYRNSSSTIGFVPLTTSPITSTSYTDADRNLVEGTTYSYRITAVNSSGQAAPSKIVSAIPYTPITQSDILNALIWSIVSIMAIVFSVYGIVRWKRSHHDKGSKRSADRHQQELTVDARQKNNQVADESERVREETNDPIKKELKFWKFWNIIRGEDWYPSLSLFQFFLWTVVILFSFIFITFIRLEHDLLPSISGLSSPSILALMGISVASPLVSGALSSIKYTTTSTFDPPDPLPGLGTMLEEGGKPSFTRFQMFAWTFISIIAFFGSMYVMITNNLNSVSQLVLPNVDPILLALMGLSQAAYIGGKAYSRTPGITSIYPRKIKLQDLRRNPGGQLVCIFGKGFGSEDNNLKSGTVWIGKVYFEWPVPAETPNGKILIWDDDKIDLKITNLDVGSYAVRVAAPEALFKTKERFEIEADEVKAAVSG